MCLSDAALNYPDLLEQSYDTVVHALQLNLYCCESGKV